MKDAISPTRAENFALWYQAVVKESELAEMSHVRGSMVIRPWGYGIWEQIQSQLGSDIKSTGAENAYFPLFIPLDYIKKEAEHVEGFAKEMAVVTHRRLTAKEGELTLDGELETPLVVRPTSETIIGASFSSWINSYRDLPLVVNQWANVVRWEMRPRIFLRTVEFLWQEGHGAFASKAEAMENTNTIIQMYQDFSENVLAVPVIRGEKPPSERFPGADSTLCIEAMMQDGKALQAGTSHYLGQNFAKAADIQFLSSEGQQEHAYTTSWGVSTRLIGALIMTHGDDDGLRVPPRIAPYHVIILPMSRKKDAPEVQDKIKQYCEDIAQRLSTKDFHGRPVAVKVDNSDYKTADLKWKWVKKGAPIVVEIGPRDLEKGSVAVLERSKVKQKAAFIETETFIEGIVEQLDGLQTQYFEEARSRMESKIVKDIHTLEQLKAYFAQEDTGFVWAKWSGDESMLKELDELSITIRCIPEQPLNETEGPCILTGEMTSGEAIFAKAY